MSGRRGMVRPVSRRTVVVNMVLGVSAATFAPTRATSGMAPNVASEDAPVWGQALSYPAPSDAGLFLQHYYKA